MRLIILIIGILTAGTVQAFNRPDTIANWQVYYGKQLITSGNENNFRVPELGTIKVNNKIEKLRIVYRYDYTKPEWRIITIKSGSQTLYDQEQKLKDNHPTLIDLQELLKNTKDKRLTIDIYYTDDVTKEQNRLISRIQLIRD